MQNSGSTNHPFRLSMQDDYNLVIYDSTWASIWSSQTWIQPPEYCYLQMRNDGNLVMSKSDGSIIWQTNTIS